MRAFVRTSVRLILASTGLSLVWACSVADIPGVGPAPRVDDAPLSSAATCAEPLEANEIDKLTACACKSGGRAHCLSKSKVPNGILEHLEGCDGDEGACVPDTILLGNPPKACKDNGEEGRCLSVCVKTVAELGSVLGRGDGDACPPDERCVPCVDPTTGKSTGICELDVREPGACSEAGKAVVTNEGEPVTCPFTGKPMDVSRFEACAPGGRCVERALIDRLVTDGKKKAELEKRLSPCGDAGLCVPEEYLKAYGQHLPATCTSFAGIEGRCFSTVFADVGAHKDVLMRDTCKESERCLPCFNPATGEPTGACSTVSCDAPKTETVPQLKDCCRKAGTMHGKCIPSSDIPQQFHERLERRECSKSELCVPAENLDPNATPQTCTPSDGGKGVCVSDCVDFRLLEAIFLRRGSCPEAHSCVPCVHPRTGEPTGAPGC